MWFFDVVWVLAAGFKKDFEKNAKVFPLLINDFRWWSGACRTHSPPDLTCELTPDSTWDLTRDLTWGRALKNVAVIYLFCSMISDVILMLPAGFKKGFGKFARVFPLRINDFRCGFSMWFGWLLLDLRRALKKCESLPPSDQWFSMLFFDVVWVLAAGFKKGFEKMRESASFWSMIYDDVLILAESTRLEIWLETWPEEGLWKIWR